MNLHFTKAVQSFRSSDGINTVSYYVYTPHRKPLGLVQIVHGMCEYGERYEDLIDVLCKEGYAVIVNDHLGHGNSVSDPEDLGYFGLADGWIYLIKDVRKTALRGRSLFGRIPHFMIGHSMGSLILRCYMAKYSGELSGCILMGTPEIPPVMPALKGIMDYHIIMHGVKSRSKKINRQLFDYLCRGLEDKQTKYDWISRDEKCCAAFAADPKCNFVFTAAGLKDILIMADYVSSPSWFKKVRKDIPLLIMGGTDDPVSAGGKAAADLYRDMSRRDFSDVSLKLLGGCRHELIHERNVKEIYGIILGFLGDRQQ